MASQGSKQFANELEAGWADQLRALLGQQSDECEKRIAAAWHDIVSALTAFEKNKAFALAKSQTIYTDELEGQIFRDELARVLPPTVEAIAQFEGLRDVVPAKRSSHGYLTPEATRFPAAVSGMSPVMAPAAPPTTPRTAVQARFPSPTMAQAPAATSRAPASPSRVGTDLDVEMDLDVPPPPPRAGEKGKARRGSDTTSVTTRGEATSPYEGPFDETPRGNIASTSFTARSNAASTSFSMRPSAAPSTSKTNGPATSSTGKTAPAGVGLTAKGKPAKRSIDSISPTNDTRPPSPKKTRPVSEKRPIKNEQERAETYRVEGTAYIFEYPAYGPGWYILACEWGLMPTYICKSNPWEDNVALNHYNNPCKGCPDHHGLTKYTEDEIVYNFAYRLEESDIVDDDWVRESNNTLAHKEEQRQAKEALKAAKGPKSAKKASRAPGPAPLRSDSASSYSVSSSPVPVRTKPTTPGSETKKAKRPAVRRGGPGGIAMAAAAAAAPKTPRAPEPPMSIQPLDDWTQSAMKEPQSPDIRRYMRKE